MSCTIKLFVPGIGERYEPVATYEDVGSVTTNTDGSISFEATESRLRSKLENYRIVVRTNAVYIIEEEK